eukprot:comp20716_c0_seq3/m.27051 comp20716_c0_seq3/g.27051  ORF comp20716_c0_seq3/g.27051 comp20716_c0_seq3/m.27051 type:complete len:122 (-) comp20716_c0_seq3:1017-1382(-)
MANDNSQTSTYHGAENYQTDRLIGKGQFSVVYRARHKPTGQIVALKTIDIFSMNDPKARSDCIKEIVLLKDLRHPRIVQCLASFMESNHLCMILELAEAGDLTRMLQHFRTMAKPIPEKTI